MTTKIKITNELQKELSKCKLSKRETYEEAIFDILEDIIELNEETKRDIELSRKEAKEGKTHIIESIKKKYGL